MTVKELIALLLICDPKAYVRLSDGLFVVDVTQSMSGRSVYLTDVNPIAYDRKED